jgi:hypothetical protein
MHMQLGPNYSCSGKQKQGLSGETVKQNMKTRT